MGRRAFSPSHPESLLESVQLKNKLLSLRLDDNAKANAFENGRIPFKMNAPLKADTRFQNTQRYTHTHTHT